MTNFLLPALHALPFIALSLSPAFLLIGALTIRRRAMAAQGLKPPVETKLLRSAGEGALKKMKALDDDVEGTLAMFLGLPALLTVFYLADKLKTARQAPGFGMIFLVLASGTLAIFAVRLFRTIQQRDTWRLGFRGERAVGEILNKLMLEGCHVFHDFPLSENWNLDHIVVAPSGVYAIETKTLNKRKSSRGQNQLSHEIIYDGKGLKFPNCYDTEKLTQAQNQADRLAQFLGNALKESIHVKPILTFPGWYVISKGTRDVTVLNPKMIHSTVLNAPPTLSSDQIKRIADFLDSKCRDVEF